MVDFRGVIAALVDSQVDFILVGGAAATAHGAARLTQDIDIVYSRAADNIARLVQAFHDHQPYLRGAPPGLPFRWDARTFSNTLNLTLTTNLGDVDLLGEITGGGRYEDLLGDTIEIELYEKRCLCLGLKRLIEVKQAAGRPKDFEAIAELQALAEARGEA